MSCPPCSRLVVAFDADVRPTPKGRPRFGSGRTYTDPRTVAYEERIGWACRAAMKGASPAEGDLSLLAVFEQVDGRRSDGDNLVKSLADAMQGIAYTNDRQITDWRFRMVVKAPRDRVSVAVLRAEVPA